MTDFKLGLYITLASPGEPGGEKWGSLSPGMTFQCIDGPFSVLVCLGVTTPLKSFNNFVPPTKYSADTHGMIFKGLLFRFLFC
jgi:hypothetical protein